ncbi:MAG: cytidine deaminase [Lachnospiraceae bacterium]|nr:cytidine deaminase [Lachnospiraceae bacterium]
MKVDFERSGGERVSAAQVRELVGRAEEQLSLAYAPYSGFCVAAALLCEDGTIYTGCNVENSSYPAGNCAERTAVFKAVSDGKREFSCIVIMGGPGGRVDAYCPPCGICRQVLREFCRPREFSVILARSREDYRMFSLEELLPESFGPEFLDG